MKRFAVFAYDTYYPGGGMSDFQVSFDTIDEARDHVAEQKSKPRYPYAAEGKDQKFKKWAADKFGEYEHYDIECMDDYQ
jgi:hypothetical protein